jgi:hypothetical protein
MGATLWVTPGCFRKRVRNALTGKGMRFDFGVQKCDKSESGVGLKGSFDTEGTEGPAMARDEEKGFIAEAEGRRRRGRREERMLTFMRKSSTSML